MGFLDALVNAGKAAGKAMTDAVTKKQLEQWEKIESASEGRLLDFYKQNNTTERNNASSRAMALAALTRQNQSKARELLRNDEDAKRALSRLREKISLEEGRSVDRLRESIDGLIK